MTWNPITDNVKKFPNIPCPYSAVIGIVNNKLNLYLTLRSNDVVCGLPYDLYFYTLLTQILANELKIKPGILFYTIANFHFYKNHQNIVNKILKYNIKNKKYKYRTKYLYNDIIKNKDKFVLEGITIDKKINKNWEFKEIADLIL